MKKEKKLPSFCRGGFLRTLLEVIYGSERSMISGASNGRRKKESRGGEQQRGRRGEEEGERVTGAWGGGSHKYQ